MSELGSVDEIQLLVEWMGFPKNDGLDNPEKNLEIYTVRHRSILQKLMDIFLKLSFATRISWMMEYDCHMISWCLM